MPALRYVVLYHTGFGEDHYDLMLELEPGAKLSTWRLPHWPPQGGDQFTPIAEHRRDYLDYEGPISGDRGSVQRVAAGDHQLLEFSPMRILIRLDNGSIITLKK
jgi:hypothetical protein